MGFQEIKHTCNMAEKKQAEVRSPKVGWGCILKLYRVNLDPLGYSVMLVQKAIQEDGSAEYEVKLYL